ncbi:MAG: serine/threonine-protein phosphatase [Muribaculum sp.]|nr:serine/threonine-protein phosphatase [Muribaculaceae bacterium]MCM1081431.1 serine/threonine-protein phosphatase [Muribaculum sp.]
MSDHIELDKPFSFIQLGKRASQQDARFPDTNTPDADYRTFIVCDGVGGEACGEVASNTVANAIGQTVAELTADGEELTAYGFSQALNAASQALNDAVDEGSPNMSTTLTFLHFNSNNAIVAHMGDSRIYQIRPGLGVIYRSNDHSLVNSMVHTGNLTPQEAIDHPKSNFITRYMSPLQPGSYPTSADLLYITDIEAGDCFLLCSDGVLHCVDDAELSTLLSRKDVPDSVTGQLLAQLCVKSSDNNTAIIVRVKSVPQKFGTINIEPEELSDVPCDTTIITPESQAPTVIEITPEPRDERDSGGLFSWFKNLF